MKIIIFLKLKYEFSSDEIKWQCGIKTYRVYLKTLKEKQSYY